VPVAGYGRYIVGGHGGLSNYRADGWGVALEFAEMVDGERLRILAISGPHDLSLQNGQVISFFNA